MVNRKTLKWGLILGVVALAVAVYVIFDPAQHQWFPKCIFRLATGLECPGCGSQRAIHRLLHLDIVGAMRQNLLLVAAVPYIMAAFVLDNVRKPGPKTKKWRAALLGRTAIWIILVSVILFWIVRNLPGIGSDL